MRSFACGGGGHTGGEAEPGAAGCMIIIGVRVVSARNACYMELGPLWPLYLLHQIVLGYERSPQCKLAINGRFQSLANDEVASSVAGSRWPKQGKKAWRRAGAQNASEHVSGCKFKSADIT